MVGRAADGEVGDDVGDVADRSGAERARRNVVICLKDMLFRRERLDRSSLSAIFLGRSDLAGDRGRAKGGRHGRPNDR